MNAPPSRLQSSINVTPLVGKGVDVDLPATAHPERRDPDPANAVTVSLRFAGDPSRAEIYLGERPMAGADELVKTLAAAGDGAPTVTLRADARRRFAAIRPAMKALQARGYPGVDLAARPLEPC